MCTVDAITNLHYDFLGFVLETRSVLCFLRSYYSTPTAEKKLKNWICQGYINLVAAVYMCIHVVTKGVQFDFHVTYHDVLTAS